MDIYLFVLCSNQSGSTLLHNLLSQCKNVISLNEDFENTTIEGFNWVKNWMPDVEKTLQSSVWTELLDTLSTESNYNWVEIKKAWTDMWKKHKNFDKNNRVFIEKSPANPSRAMMMYKNFDYPYFVCQVRNPYIVAEGVFRRCQLALQTEIDIRRAAKHSIKALQIQKNNIETVPNLIAWRYEDISEIPEVLEKLVNDSIPNITDFKFTREFYASSLDGYTKKEFVNFNDRQFERIDEQMLRIMNEEFKPYKNVMKFFNYDWIENND